MHELSLSSAIVEAAARHANGRSISAVNLRVGRLRQVVPESLQFYFGFVAEGTVCATARLQQTIVAARLRCSACEHEWEPEWPLFLCPSCDGIKIEVLAGYEFEIESIEIEEASDASSSSQSA